MPSTLAKIEPLVPPIIPPKGDDGQPARAVGEVNGRILYERKLIRAAKNKAPELDPTTGEQKWEKHPTTGTPLYSRWKNVREERTQRFTMEPDGQGNLYVQEYHPPSVDEIARHEREAKVAAFKDQLATEAVERGLSVGALLDLASGGGAQPAAGLELSPVERFKDELASAALAQGITAEQLLGMLTSAVSPADGAGEGESNAAGSEEGTPGGADFPRNYAPGRWELSNGAKMQGSREAAEAAERALHEIPPA